MTSETAIKVSTLVPDIAIFVGGSVLQYGVVYWAVPALSAAGIEPLAAWMLLSIPLIFMPIIVCGLMLLRTEHRPRAWTERLRLERPSAQDWRWGVVGLVGMGLGSGVLFQLCAALGLDSTPPFARHVQPLTSDRLWLLGLWAVYWPINIFGENLIWRGILLPRMEARLGGWAWLLNAALWSIFHFAFGLGNLIVLAPTLVVVPLIAQWRRNTWLAVLLHAGLSGPGFVALALGLT